MPGWEQEMSHSTAIDRPPGAKRPRRGTVFGVCAMALASTLIGAPEGPPAWTLSARAVFPQGNPAGAEVELLIELLERPEGEGLPLTVEEFKSVCDHASPVVYASQLIKYATPRSLEIQNSEHADFSKVFMKEKRQEAGVRFLQDHEEALAAAEEKYGVPIRDIVSILMWESGLGEFTGKHLVFNIFMGQLLYLSDAREHALKELRARPDFDDIQLPPEEKERIRLERVKKRAARNLAALLRLAKEKGVDATIQQGSWGGAVGYPQFIPASLIFAVDGNGDGTIDLNSWPDAIHSVANYLKSNGYGKTDKKRRKGLHAYNPIHSYVNGVILYANAIWKRYSETTDKPSR